MIHDHQTVHSIVDQLNILVQTVCVFHLQQRDFLNHRTVLYGLRLLCTMKYFITSFSSMFTPSLASYHISFASAASADVTAPFPVEIYYPASLF
jgi:hypothetical protein